MTENEAIELLRSMQNPKQDYADIVCAPAFCTGFRFVYPEPEDYAIEEAIKALKEIQQYREIGTVEECREAMANKKKCEKQWHNDMENPLEPIKVYSALKSEILKLELRIKNRPHPSGCPKIDKWNRRAGEQNE